MRIREIREDKDLTQTEVAKILNVSQVAYSFYEIGKRRPTTMKLLSIAQFHNVSIDYIVGRSDNKNIK